MDIYTTSFTLPPQSHSVARTTSPASISLPLPDSNGPDEDILAPIAPPPPLPTSSSTTCATVAQAERDWESIKKLVVDISTREGCLVTVTKEPPPRTSFTDPTSPDDESSAAVWNFHLSGSHQSVMASRGAILREYPRDNRFVLKVARTDVLEHPLAALSLLRPEVQRRLDGIAAETLSCIVVVNEDTEGGEKGKVLGQAGQMVPKAEQVAEPNGRERRRSGGSGSSASQNVTEHSTISASSAKSVSSTSEEKDVAASVRATPTMRYGFETERMCEIVITGKLECVELAKVLVLALLDELSGLHAEICDIDYKLHSIIAGRRRTVIQSIREETATNIYYPVPLVGIHDRPQPSTNNLHTSSSYRHLHPGISSGGMMPLSSQNTGMTQMSGFSQAPSSAVGMTNGWHSQPGQFMPGYQAPQAHGRPMHHQPQHHMQYPYHPHQPPYDQSHRGTGYPTQPMYGHHHQHQNQHQHHPVPMSMQNTGATNMTGFQTPRGMSPRHMGASGHYNQQHHQQQQNYHHHAQQHHQQYHNDQHYGNGHQHNGYVHQHQHMNGGLSHHHLNGNPYANGMGHAQNHVHVGLAGGHVGMNGGMSMGMNGMNGNGNGHPPGQGHTLGMHGHYGQGPHPGLSVHGGEQGSLGKANQIWITGEFFNVQRARDMLLNVAMQKSKMVISRDTAILPRKLDWLLTERLEDVKTIMSDNGTYLQLPAVGSQISLITVFGDHRVNIERTIRSIMVLVCQFYVASIWLLPLALDVLMPRQSTLNPAEVQPILKHISHMSGAEVVFKSNCFEMHGTEQQVRMAVTMVQELEMIQGFHHEIRFQIELANEHRDFISGKKNGKINKIMKLANVKIKFETLNDYNFLMEVSGSDLGALHGLSMLQEELPEEVSFHIPETYHKRIIGVAGKNIQRIMKLYGVYVKFSNAEEFAALGGYADNEDNVIARTPAKNAVNLESLKQSVMELVIPKDKDYIIEAISVPRRYHRTLLGEKSIFIHDIEKKTNSRVRFPYAESASDLLTIFGPEAQISIAASMLLDHVPFEADLQLLHSPELITLVSSTDFISFTEGIKRDHQIIISPSAKFGQADEAILKFRCQRSNLELLTAARDAFEEFFNQHNVYPAQSQTRIDTFADSLHHLNSRLLAKRARAAAKQLAEDDTNPPPAIRARPLPTDVKALFDGPSHIGTRDDITNGERGFAGPLSYRDPRRSNKVEYWQSQSPQTMRTDLLPTSNAPVAEPSKRESDPLIQDKVRQATLGPGVPLTPHRTAGSGHPRGAAARTQSLDITSLNFSRALSSNAGGFGPVPASPVAILGVSPNTASGQYFPSASGAGGSKRVSYESAMESATHALAKTHV